MKRTWAILPIGLSLLWVTVLSLVAAEPATLQVGTRAVNLKADDAMVIAGGIGPGKAQGQEGELRATAVVLAEGPVKVAIVSCDVLMLTRDLLDPVAAEIESTCGIPVSHVLIHTTHTHHAPSTMRVHAYDRATGRVARMSPSECGFGYRDSIFKREPDRRIVTAVDMRLPRQGATRIDYAGIREELAAMGGLEATPCNVAKAVRRIRRRKLPDPAVVGNAGSFFKNPIVPLELAAELQARHHDLPVYPAGEANRKLSAAWLIERSGWRGFREGDAGVSAQHALVLVNHGAASGAQLLAVARRVVDSVAREFGVRLEPEPRIIGAVF